MSDMNKTRYMNFVKERVDQIDGLDVVSLDINDACEIICVLEADTSKGVQLEGARHEIELALSQMDGIRKVSVILTARRGAKSSGKVAAQAARIENLAPNIKHIIAVASGKGGVGKSTVAVNIAAGLAKAGLKTGLMDADIYGPSVPMMLGRRLEERPPMKNEKIIPPEAHGLKLMSMGFLVPEDAPMIWRGPMIQTALRQFLQDVDWGDLDVLIVDMPPGTGDAQLTMAQKVPLAGAIIVSTPQDIALLDARKGLNMFRQVGVPVIGMVENMSMYSCPSCGHEAHIFGHGGAKNEAQKMDCAFLGALPLDIKIREYADQGTPIVLADPAHPASFVYRDICAKIMNSIHFQKVA